LGGFEVNFLPEYKALQDAGYNILCYDIRNHGLSGSGNGGTVGIGLLEYRDVIGLVRYGDDSPRLKPGASRVAPGIVLPLPYALSPAPGWCARRCGPGRGPGGHRGGRD
jgi:hypothetical protein